MDKLGTILGSPLPTDGKREPLSGDAYYARIRSYSDTSAEDYCVEYGLCRRCGGNGWVVKRAVGATVADDHDRLAPCGSCWHEARERRWQAIGVKARLTFGDWVDVPELRAALQKCRALMDGKCWSVFLSAGTGRGKTHLALATVVEFVEAKTGSALFRSAPDLFAELRDSYSPDNPHTLNDLVKRCETVDLLVIDDLGTEYHKGNNGQPDWVDEQLFRIIDGRYQRKRRTLITSNLAPTSTMIPARIRSRLAGGAVVIEGGKDYRQQEYQVPGWAR